MEKSLQKSEEQAQIIKLIALALQSLDVEYCRQAAIDICNRASWQESAAVLNPNHSQLKNDILRAQGKALHTLCEYVMTLKEIDRLKAELAKENKTRDDIERMFI